MNWTPEQYRAHQMRLGEQTQEPPRSAEVEREIPLHNRIMIWCNSRIPRVPYIHARPDQKSRIAMGCQDFTVFYKGSAICIECKAKDGKLSVDQTIWAHLMKSQGFTVWIVCDFATFLSIVEAPAKERELA